MGQDKPLDLAAIEARYTALESHDPDLKGHIRLTAYSGKYLGNDCATVRYGDNDLCAEVYDNIGSDFSGDAYAEFFAHAVSDIPVLIARIRELEKRIEALDLS